ncbi:MAG: CBS domain-containing protein [Alphaproteobacteria bacterium]|nr:CBS domain-containing protein [Alphaproteobacteria bacterium]
MSEIADKKPAGFFEKFQKFMSGKSDATLREVIEEYVQENEETPGTDVTSSERALISNVLKLHEMRVADVMVPRADIVAIDIDTSKEDLLHLLTERQFSRLPVYRETLDEVIGTIHIKDILAKLARNESFAIKDLVRDVPLVSPSLPVHTLILQMRESRKHMVLVVDEYGGIDGMVTIGDVVEEIVGVIDDEHTYDDEPDLKMIDDKTAYASARYDIEEFEEKFGRILNEEERETLDTLGGLVFSIAGRVPLRGEVLTHEESGIIFEITDADQRRVRRLRIRNLPAKHEAA